MDINEDVATHLAEQFFIHPEELLHDQLLQLKYPGSSKGMRPEDDPENYDQYVINNSSDSYYRFISDVSKYIEENKKEKSVQVDVANGQQNFFNMLNQDGFMEDEDD